VLLGVCLSVALAEPAPGVTFTKVADTNTLVPAGQWVGEQFRGFGIPGIHEGNVVFLGDLSSSSLTLNNGVYKWKDGALGLVADPSTPRPGGGNPFGALRNAQVHGEEYAFAERSGLGFTYGVFQTIKGKLTSIGALPVTHTHGHSLDARTVWFYGYSFRLEGPSTRGFTGLEMARSRN
jgi:hypothetical protein